MDSTYILYLGRHTLETALLVAAPIMLVSVIMGLAISLFQAVTSLKDMTLTLVPKLLAIGVTSLFFGNWMMQVVVKFTLEIFNQIQSYGQS
ncbi:MAG: flagellar biosynthetic protein FliQ [Phycisphaerae bacterium]|nr:flagellar biosynthetic protein FliQ [Phycisphaerae bacterium]